MKMSKRIMAMMLAAVMTFTSSGMSVFAEGAQNAPVVEISTEEVSEETTVEETSEEAASEEAVEEVTTEVETVEESAEESTAEETTVEETTEEVTTEEEATTVEETTAEETTTVEETIEEVTTEEETTTVEETTEEATTEVNEENWNGSGHKAPKLEMNLTSAMVAEKEAIQGTAERLELLESEISYVKDEAVFLASSKEYALEVAEGYGATLSSYEEGVAVITFDDDVTEIIAMAEDMDVMLPAVYPNFIYTIYDDVISEEDLTDVNGSIESISEDEIVDLQTYHTDIKTEAAWDYNDKAGKGIKVAVIDSGVQKNHEDLNGKATALSTCTSPWNKAADNNGHGTHVSGIIAAKKDNGLGGAGIAYNASIISVKALEQNPIVLEDCGGYTSDIIKAVNTSVKKGARVINMSLGGYGYDALYESSINNAVNKGVVVVAAAGNETTQLSTDISSGKYVSPACFENVITVSATNTGATTLASFSNYGNGIVDIAAPGTQIASSVPGGYKYMSGTSQATPQVAAVAAYILSVRADLVKSKSKATVDTVTKILKDSATKTGYTNTTNFGSGLLNVEKAVQMAAPSEKNETVLQAPTILVNGNAATKNQKIQDTDTITMSSALGENANNEIKIYYTTNGKNPTEKSTLYTGAFKLSASGKKTIKAIAVYYGTKSKVVSVPINVNAYVTGFTIGAKTGVNSVSSGKSLTLVTSNFAPAYATNKKVTWEITDGAEYATINAKGVLKANKGITEKKTVTVVATAQDRKVISAMETFTIVPAVTKLALTDPADAACTLTYPATKQMNVTATPAEINPPITYTSSNKKVATVDANGKITAVGAGKATITAKTADGSNKSCKMNVTVKKAVQGVTVTSKTGLYTTAAGKALQMVATVTKDATNKKVDWSVTEVDGVSITSKGQLKSDAKKIKTVTEVTVTAKAQDESGKLGSTTVTIYPAATSAVLMENAKTLNIGTKASGNLKTTVQLYPYTKNYTEAYIGRAQNSGETNLGNFTYKSSKTSVATVSATGLVTAVAPGTAKITITAKDGSNKKVVCTIKVVKPVTAISVVSKTGVNFVGKGKSMTLGAVVNTDATNKKIQWTSANNSIATVTNGKVTGKSYGSDIASVEITATAMDGSGHSDTFTVYVLPAVSKLVFAYRSLWGSGYSASVVDTQYYEEEYSSEYETYIPVPLYDGAIPVPYYQDSTMRSNQYGVYDLDLLDIKLSNSNVLQFAYDKSGQMNIVPVNKGTCDIIYKTLDGSGKSCKIRVTVK